MPMKLFVVRNEYYMYDKDKMVPILIFMHMQTIAKVTIVVSNWCMGAHRIQFILNYTNTDKCILLWMKVDIICMNFYEQIKPIWIFSFWKFNYNFVHSLYIQHDADNFSFSKTFHREKSIGLQSIYYLFRKE